MPLEELIVNTASTACFFGGGSGALHEVPQHAGAKTPSDIR
jgi:hypothetical protein